MGARTCLDCGTDISERHGLAKLCHDCGYARGLSATARYQATPEGAASVRRAVAAFLERPGGREAQRAAARRYSQTEKGKAALRAGRLRYDERQRRKRAALKGVVAVALLVMLLGVACAGPKGEPGLTGPMGPEGTVGLQGASGDQGEHDQGDDARRDKYARAAAAMQRQAVRRQQAGEVVPLSPRYAAVAKELKRQAQERQRSQKGKQRRRSASRDDGLRKTGIPQIVVTTEPSGGSRIG